MAKLVRCAHVVHMLTCCTSGHWLWGNCSAGVAPRLSDNPTLPRVVRAVAFAAAAAATAVAAAAFCLLLMVLHQVDLVTQDALALLQQWGIIEEVDYGRYQLMPLPEAVQQLRAQALLSVSGVQQQTSLLMGRPPAAAGGTGSGPGWLVGQDQAGHEGSQQAAATATSKVVEAAARLTRVNAVGTPPRHQQQQGWGASNSRRLQVPRVSRQHHVPPSRRSKAASRSSCAAHSRQLVRL